MTGFFETLLRPDKDEVENMDRREVGQAANILQVGEFQLLQLAYREWHGADLPEDQVDRLFHHYMIDSSVPHWARHYARQIIRLNDAGRVADTAPHYHRYDDDYGPSAPPHGLRRFLVATGIVVLVVGSGVMGAVMSTGEAATQFPPYVSQEDLQANATPDEIVLKASRSVLP